MKLSAFHSLLMRLKPVFSFSKFFLHKSSRGKNSLEYRAYLFGMRVIKTDTQKILWNKEWDH